jgi:hypothetical protein
MKLLAAVSLLFAISTVFGNEDDFSYIDSMRKKSDSQSECNEHQCAVLKSELKFLDTRIAHRNLKIKRIENAMLYYNGPIGFVGGAICFAFVNPAISFLLLGGALVSMGNAHVIRPVRHSWHQKMLFNLAKKRDEAQEKFKHTCKDPLQKPFEKVP